MRKVVLLAVALIAMPAMAVAQKETAPPGMPKKGDPLTVKGCLSGGSLLASDVLNAAGAAVEMASGLTFRLTGDKKVLKQLRDDHNGKVVSVEGVLKSDLPRDSVDTRQLGKMRVTIGAVSSPNATDAETRRSLPVLDAKAFDGTTISCGR